MGKCNGFTKATLGKVATAQCATMVALSDGLVLVEFYPFNMQNSNVGIQCST